VRPTFQSINPNPKEPIADPTALLEIALGQAGFAGRSLRDLANYPPAQPWKSRPPTRGPRRGGRRTGNLGRNWRLFNNLKRERWEWGTRNATRYAIYVEGPVPGKPRQRQVPNMRQRGWPNITRVGRQNWTFYRYRVIRILMQNDPGLRYRTARR
jgi:hypothetical protein